MWDTFSQILFQHTLHKNILHPKSHNLKLFLISYGNVQIKEDI